MAEIDVFTGQNAFLSNFYASCVELDGERYATVEHAYQAAKTLDEDERERIRKAQTAGKAKHLGRRVQMRPDWDAIKKDIMYSLLVQKFAIPHLRKRLLATGDEKLIEGNYWGDRFWGMCRSDKGEWEGQNNLGKLLMEIRGDLRSEVNR